MTNTMVETKYGRAAVGTEIRGSRGGRRWVGIVAPSGKIVNRVWL